MSPLPTSKRQSYGSSARKGGAWFAGAEGINLLVQVPVSMVLARLLSPSEFGVAAVATMVVQFGYRATQFGLNTALVRIKDLQRGHESSVFVFNLVVGALAFLACVFASPAVGRFFGSAEAGRLLPFSAAVFLIVPFGTVPNALLNRQLRFRELASVGVLNTLVASSASIALAWQGFSYWSLPAGALMASAASVARQRMLAGWKPGLGFSRQLFAELLNYGGGVQVKRLIAHGRSNLDTVIIGRMLGVTALGLYDKGFSTVSRLTQRFEVGATTTFRILAVIFEDPPRFRIAMQKIIMVAGLLAFPVLAAGIVVSRELFVVLYGEAWIPSVPVFQFLCAAGACQVLSSYLGNANEAVGRVWWQAATQAASLVVLVLSVVTGARVAGVAGASAGVALASSVELMLAMTVLRSSTSLTWKDLAAPLVIPTLCASGLVLVLVSTRRGIVWLGVDSPLLLLSTELVVGSLYAAAFAVWCPDRGYRAIAADFVEDVAPKLPPTLALWLTRRFLQPEGRPKRT